MKKITYLKSGGVVKLDLEKLEGLQKAFGVKFVTQVGILGSKATREEAGGLRKEGGHKILKRRAAPETNAEIGLAHEKGIPSQHLSRRSFLYDTFFFHAEGLQAIRHKLWEVFKFGKESMARLHTAYAELGRIAEKMVDAAFATGGFGKWPDIKPLTKIRKKSTAILIDTGQLRRSISSRVVAK